MGEKTYYDPSEMDHDFDPTLEELKRVWAELINKNVFRDGLKEMQKRFQSELELTTEKTEKIQIESELMRTVNQIERVNKEIENLKLEQKELQGMFKTEEHIIRDHESKKGFDD